LEKRKNQVGLVDLFAEIALEWPKARLVLVGDGPDRGEIRRRIDKHQLESKVHLLGTRRDVPALLQSADIYLHYSTLENCPVALIEAARASLPIAAIPAGGVPELLSALDGFALDSGSNVASLETLRPLMSNPDVREQAGKASRAAFERAFTREAMVAGYVDALLPRAAAAWKVAS
jgi:glycosyltransferase involved in cell wall biosynthesis